VLCGVNLSEVANRIKGLLFSQGASGYEPLRRDRRARLDALQTGDGRRLPRHLKAQVCRELDRLELLLEQIEAAEAERDALLNAETKVSAPPPMLLGVHGVGPEFASVLWSEGLSRHFDNRRQVAADAGLAPAPWQSGSVNREQSISQSGNPRLTGWGLHPLESAAFARRTREAVVGDPAERAEAHVRRRFSSTMDVMPPSNHIEVRNVTSPL
jgi:transposase